MALAEPFLFTNQFYYPIFSPNKTKKTQTKIKTFLLSVHFYVPSIMSCHNIQFEEIKGKKYHQQQQQQKLANIKLNIIK